MINMIWEKCHTFAKSKNEVEQIVKSTFEVISDAIKKKEDVKVRGFGTFKLQAPKTIKRKMPGSDDVKTFKSKSKIKFVSSGTFGD